MVIRLLFMFAIVGGGLTLEPPQARQAAALDAALAPRAPDLAAGDSGQLIPRLYLPFIARPAGCAPIPGVNYSTLSVNPPPTDRPAEEHADLNLALRGYEVTSAALELVTYGGHVDPGAPKLYTLFADRRVPAFTTAYKVYDWDWNCNCRAGLLTTWPVTLLDMGTAAGEVLYVPDSGYDIGNGYEALVLYASEDRITLKYTRDDNVVYGFTIHVEEICVEPSLLALYRASNDAGRGQLPALRGGEPFGRALGTTIGVAIRDSGSFMDPRSRWDWW